MAALRCSFRYRQHLSKQFVRHNSDSTTSAPVTSTPTPASAPRHFLSLADVSSQELRTLVINGIKMKKIMNSPAKAGRLEQSPFVNLPLQGKTISLTFSKRSTRTRVSTESAIARLGGHPMFLGKEDIQLGVNESLRDTSVVISSMVDAMVARVGPHSDVSGLAEHSSVPVINGLSDDFHPLQAVANMMTAVEAFETHENFKKPGLGLAGLKMAWVGDANNVLYDIAMACQKFGIHLSVATPKGFEIPAHMEQLIREQGEKAGTSATLTTTHVPDEAVKGANMIVTDTWVSMGQEAEKAERIRQFEGFQVTSELATRGGAAENWKFMHCLPRKPEEVSDEVFYDPERSLVFQEAENRLWGMMSVLWSFVVRSGKISGYPPGLFKKTPKSVSSEAPSGEARIRFT